MYINVLNCFLCVLILNYVFSLCAYTELRRCHTYRKFYVCSKWTWINLRRATHVLSDCHGCREVTELRSTATHTPMYMAITCLLELFSYLQFIFHLLSLLVGSCLCPSFPFLICSLFSIYLFPLGAVCVLPFLSLSAVYFPFTVSFGNCLCPSFPFLICSLFSIYLFPLGAVCVLSFPSPYNCFHNRHCCYKLLILNVWAHITHPYHSTWQTAGCSIPAGPPVWPCHQTFTIARSIISVWGGSGLCTCVVAHSREWFPLPYKKECERASFVGAPCRWGRTSKGRASFIHLESCEIGEHEFMCCDLLHHFTAPKYASPPGWENEFK